MLHIQKCNIDNSSSMHFATWGVAGVTEQRQGGRRNFTFMHYTYLVVTVKTAKIGVHLPKTPKYRKIKMRVPLFGTPCIHAAAVYIINANICYRRYFVSDARFASVK